MPSIRGGWNATRTLAAAALTLGLLAMIAGDPARALDSVGGAARVGGADEAEGRISAIELARMIRDRAPGLRIVELRPAGDSNEYRIPGAERVSLAELTTTQFASSETLVLYSDGDSSAVEGSALLRARGHRVYHLHGGLFAWIDEVMEARITADASDSERAAFRETAELSRYFGGQPTINDRPRHDAVPLPTAGASGARATKSGKAAARQLERRGC